MFTGCLSAEPGSGADIPDSRPSIEVSSTTSSGVLSASGDDTPQVDPADDADHLSTTGEADRIEDASAEDSALQDESGSAERSSTAVSNTADITPLASFEGFNFYQTSHGVHHAQTWGSISWESRYRFNIPDLWLKDTSCDSQPVYVKVWPNWDPTWVVRKRFNHGGCGSQFDFKNVHAEVGDGLRGFRIEICRDTYIPECSHKDFFNPRH
jgi:hypothetical protein